MDFDDFDRDPTQHRTYREFTGRTCSLRQSRATQAALAEAIVYAEDCMHDARLLTPFEAMALACGESREKETLYSIACRFAQREGVDLDDLLCDLGAQFPDYS